MMVQAQTAMEAPTATEAPSASVTDLTAASNGSIVSMSVSSLPSGSQFALVVSYRYQDQPEWSEPAGQSGFHAWPYQKSTPYGQTVYITGCRTGGEYKVDVYSGSRLLASTKVDQQASNLDLRQHNDWVGGIQLCRPDAWIVGGTATGSADISSADGRSQVSMRAAPLAVPPDTEATRLALVEGS